MKSGSVRSLTDTEIMAVPDIFRTKLDLARIRVHNRRWTFLTPVNITVARGYNIFWPDSPVEAASPHHLAHLVHEVVHVWQYNIINVGLYSWRWLDRRYAYEADTARDFLAYGLEQQASMVEDYKRLEYGLSVRHGLNAPSQDYLEQIINTATVLR